MFILPDLIGRLIETTDYPYTEPSSGIDGVLWQVWTTPAGITFIETTEGFITWVRPKTKIEILDPSYCNKEMAYRKSLEGDALWLK